MNFTVFGMDGGVQETGGGSNLDARFKLEERHR